MPKSEETLLVEAYQAGLSIRDLAEAVGLTPWGICLRLRKYGVKLRPRGRPMEKRNKEAK